MTGASTRIKRAMTSAGRGLRPLRHFVRMSVRPLVSIIGNSLVRIAELMGPEQKAQEFLKTYAPKDTIMLCIYRERNRPTVTALVEQAQRFGIKTSLWALDKPLTELAAHTVGCGPGPRMDLLNRLYQTVEPDACHQLIIADDDIVFTRGSLAQLLGAAILCEFGIAQPAHDWTSNYSYSINRMKPFLLARHSTFVEPGPLVVLTRPWIDQVMPFPENFGMGYGIWLLWQNLQPKGCKLGIIDCVTVKHLSPVGKGYASAVQVEDSRLKSLIRDHGYQSADEAKQILGAWKIRQPVPPWKAELDI